MHGRLTAAMRGDSIWPSVFPGVASLRDLHRLVFFLLLTFPSFSQSIAIGVKGGIRATNDVEGSGTSESKRYLVGPAVEVILPFRIAVEVDALYSRFGLRSGTGGFYGYTIQSQRANSWEFPILGKFRLVRPFFVEAGYVPRTMSGSTHSDSFLIDINGKQPRQTGDRKADYQLTHGLLAGGGVDLPFGRLRLSPEFRYTRWLNRSFDIEGSHGFSLKPAQNRVEILVGIWWK